MSVTTDWTTQSLFPEYQESLQHTTGLLPSQHIRRLVDAGRVAAPGQPIAEQQIQPASLDLRLGPVAHRVHASFLPGAHSTVASRIEELRMHGPIDLREPVMLERGCVYIIRLLEELKLPPGVSGKANPKSTTGRLDVFTRLITDHGTEFERVASGYRGPLYVEVVPRTFNILVKEGLRLNQLRFVRGSPPPSDSMLDVLHRRETLVFNPDDSPGEALISNGLWISVDLSGDGSGGVVGYRARAQGNPLVDLTKIGHYDPAEYWEPVRARKGAIVLEPDDFYILVSREKVRIPPTHAAEMVAYEPPIGEFRVHYAGFFDPGFGHGNNRVRGTRGVLEVRSHEVPFLLEDGQLVGRLIYERLLEVPDRLYGKEIGSSYQEQGLKLSKQFRPFAQG
jgi:dCTP deaminase